MTSRRFSFAIALTLIALAGCERKREPNKILDGLPVNNETTVPVGEAVQELHLLTQDAMNTAVTVINRLSQTGVAFNDVAPVGTGQYQFSRTGSRYGTATFTMTFRDATTAVIDPIAVPTSSGSLKTVTITGSGSSSRFSYSVGSWVLTLETEGVVLSNKTLTGPTVFTRTNPNYTLNFSWDGNRATFLGVSSGPLSATGSGPSAPVTLSATYNSDRAVDGTLTWEGETAGIHLAPNGTGFLVTDTARLLIE